MPRPSPAAISAANDDPYSTSRRSSRFHQTRWGMPCTSPWPPVATDARQTGVSDGNVETARRKSPLSSRKRSVGASVASSIDGVSPSIRIRMACLATVDAATLIAGERAQARMPLGLAAAKAAAERGQRRCLEIPEDGHERERRGDQRREADEQRGAPPRAAAAQR